jgi:hypothetical protein
MTNFVIAYDKSTGNMLLHQDADPHRARRLHDALVHCRPDCAWEIVTLVADELATIQQTHSRYFTGAWVRVPDVRVLSHDPMQN